MLEFKVPRSIVCFVVAFALTIFILLRGLLITPAQHSINGAFQPEYDSILPKGYGRKYKGASNPIDINRVTNETLGFSKIFVVGMPERTDKRDALALTSDLTGFNIEWIDGIRGEDIVDKAIPFGLDRSRIQKTFRGGERSLGSWRAHMNAIRRTIDEDLDWALIMEDDVDWDVRIKSQLEQVANGVRWLSATGAKEKLVPKSPYGDNWDVLWLGHCGDLFPEHLSELNHLPSDDPGMRWLRRRYVIENDPTVPPRANLTGMQGVDVIRGAPERTRMVHIAGAPVCTFAYALSHAGAQKVLFDLSVDHLRGTMDNALGALCRDGVLGEIIENTLLKTSSMGIRCVAVSPPVFFHHKSKGSLENDSDILPQSEKDEESKKLSKGFTENVVWSARNKIRNMLLDSEMESQF